MFSGKIGIRSCLIFVTKGRWENWWFRGTYPSVWFLPSSEYVTCKGSAPHRSTIFLHRLTQNASLAVYMRYRGTCNYHEHDYQSFCCYYIGIYRQVTKPKVWYEAQNKLISYICCTCLSITYEDYIKSTKIITPMHFSHMHTNLTDPKENCISQFNLFIRFFFFFF